MDTNASLDYRNPTFVRNAGMTALKNELGTVGAAYFMRQFSAGSGDYTAERDQILDGLTLEDVIADARKFDANTG